MLAFKTIPALSVFVILIVIPSLSLHTLYFRKNGQAAFYDFQ